MKALWKMLDESPWLKSGLIGALFLTTCWLLAPTASVRQAEEGVIEIIYMSPEGPIKDAVADAVREFELLSRRRHEESGGAYPIYRVVAGQHASRNQVEDPTRFLLSLLGGQPPDVIFFDRFAISEWASRKAFLPLDTFVEKDLAAWDTWQTALKSDPAATPPWPGAIAEPPRAEGARPLPAIVPIRRDDFFPGAWDEAVYTDPRTGESGLYGIPCNADTRVMLYNKDMLIRHGYTNEVGEARPPRTWEELEEMTAGMVERNERGELQSVGYIPDFGDTWLYMYAWQAGAELMSPDGRQARLNSPEMVRGLEYMARLYDLLGGAEQVNAFKSTFRGDALDPFILGKVAIKTEGVWVMSSLARFGRDVNIGAAPPPLPADRLAAGHPPATLMAGWAYAIPSSTPKAEHAWELIRYLAGLRAIDIQLQAEVLSHQAEGRPFLPRQYPHRTINDHVYDTYVENNPDIEPTFKQVMEVYSDSLEWSRYRPVTPVGQKMWTQQRKAMEDAFYKTRPSIQATLDYHQGIVQRDLDAMLHPREGLVIRSWNWFLVLYALLAAGIIYAVYRSDAGMKTGGGGIGRRIAGMFSTEDINRPAVTEGKKGSYFRAQWKEGVICAAPWIIGFLLFTGGPLLFSIIISFCRFDVLSPAVWVGLSNYSFLLFQDELFWVSLWNTLYMIIGVPLGLLLGLGIAMLLTQKVRGVALWRTFFYLPSIVPIVASSILWIWIFNPSSGLLNALLEAVGLQGRMWLQDPATSKWALIMMGLWTAGGGMVVWIAGIKGISESYYEAASIDGANAWQRFRHITIPMLTPYIFFNLIMGFIGTFQIFAQAFIMTGGGPADSTLFYVYHLFNNAFRFLNMGQASAMAWILFVIVLALTALQMKWSKKWVHYEGE